MVPQDDQLNVGNTTVETEIRHSQKGFPLPLLQQNTQTEMFNPRPYYRYKYLKLVQVHKYTKQLR